MIRPPKVAWTALGLLVWAAVAMVLGLPLYGLIGTLAWDEDPLVDMPAIELLPVLGLGTVGLALCLGVVYLIVRGPR